VSDPAELDYCYLTTTGRVSGAPHRIEIWFALQGETVFLLSGGVERSDWVRNLMISPEVGLELGDRRRTTRARVVEPGTDEDALARRLLFDKYTARGNTDLKEWAATALAVAIDWPTATTYTSLL
jgi:deazaflavin-dependent oxidoreductase (nitroreductase family)